MTDNNYSRRSYVSWLKEPRSNSFHKVLCFHRIAVCFILRCLTTKRYSVHDRRWTTTNYVSDRFQPPSGIVTEITSASLSAGEHGAEVPSQVTWTSVTMSRDKVFSFSFEYHKYILRNWKCC
jgi:hypothetical protein